MNISFSGATRGRGWSHGAVRHKGRGRASSVTGLALGLAFVVAACAGANGPAPGSASPSSLAIPPTQVAGSATTPAGSATATVGRPTPTISALPTGHLTPCQTDQLTIALVDSAVAAGTDGGWLRFTDTGAPCSMQGWPRLVGVTANGSTTVATETDALLTFPLLTAPPLVPLARGDVAYAAFAGSDTQPGARTCGPSYRSLRVSPPHDRASVVISAWLPYFNGYLPACVGIAVTFVIPASARQ